MPTKRGRHKGRFTADFGMCPKNKKGGFGWMVKLLPLLTGTMSGAANTALRKLKGGKMCQRGKGAGARSGCPVNRKRR